MTSCARGVRPVPEAARAPVRSVHVDAGEILEPALRRAKAFYLGRHRSRVQVVDDPYPGRLVDDQLMRRGEDFVTLGRDERLLRLRLAGVDRHLMKVRSRKFALDSALEGAVMSEPVSGSQIPC